MYKPKHFYDFPPLPPAFKALDPLFAELGASEAALRQITKPFRQAEKWEALLDRRNELQSAVSKLFEEILLQQAALGDFSVTKVSGIRRILDFRGTDGLIAESPLKFKVFEAFLECPADRSEIEHLESSFNWIGSHLDTECATLLWSRLKEALVEEVSDKQPGSYNPQGFLLYGLLTGNMLKEKEVLELARSIYSHPNSLPLSQITAHQNDRETPLHLPFFFDAIPYFVFTFNPEFYNLQISKCGIDPKVAEILLGDWPGDFTSFLCAARSLSADEH